MAFKWPRVPASRMFAFPSSQLPPSEDPHRRGEHILGGIGQAILEVYGGVSEDQGGVACDAQEAGASLAVWSRPSVREMSKADGLIFGSRWCLVHAGKFWSCWAGAQPMWSAASEQLFVQWTAGAQNAGVFQRPGDVPGRSDRGGCLLQFGSSSQAFTGSCCGRFWTTLAAPDPSNGCWADRPSLDC